LSVMGGKLTTYRATALQALARIQPGLPERRAVADSAELLLTPVPHAR
jgi:glycerol-3-phosphate dehydrogenase